MEENKLKYSYMTSQEAYLYPFILSGDISEAFVFTFEVTKCIAVLPDGIFHQVRNYNWNHYMKYLLEGGAKMTDFSPPKQSTILL